MHKLLQNQIKKFLGEEEPLSDKFKDFLKAVDQAYYDSEEDYARLDQAQNLIAKELEIQYRQKELLLQSAGEGIIGVDLKGNIIFFNPAACRMLGYAPQELLGHSFINMALHSRPDGSPYLEQTCPMRKALNDSACYRQSNEVFWKKNGESFPVDYSCTPVLDRNEVKGAMIVFKNISEQILTQQALERYTRELEERKRDLEEFNAIASHDLKEPLRKISQFGEMLSEKIKDRLEAKEKEYFSKMINAAVRMEQLITHLLEFSKVGIKSLKFEDIDLIYLIEEVTHLLEMRIHQAGGKVRISSAHSRYRPVVHADRNQMHQLFQNLISNSIKYHRPEVPPEVIIMISTEDEGSIKIEIQDNGIGFDESHIQKIFKPFERLHGRSEYEGTGMGLAICKKIVTRHGGSIDVASQAGIGSTFTITLPTRHLSADENIPPSLPPENDSKLQIMA